jgi:anti-sigma regulatory factor (Ser/Thr protein kinase)
VRSLPGANCGQPDVHRLSVPSDLAFLDTVRKWLVTHATSTSLSSGRAYDLRVVASEAVANAIEHGNGDVTIEVRVQPDRLVVDVTNAGTFQRAVCRGDQGRQRGLGLPLMASLADQLHVDCLPGGTTRVSASFLFEGKSS